MDYRIAVTPSVVEVLKSHHVYLWWGQSYARADSVIHFDEKLRIEPFTQLASNGGDLISLGMCSYINNSTLHTLNVEVGRYSSIADGFSDLNFGHPAARFTTSPISMFIEWEKLGFMPQQSGLIPENGFTPISHEEDRPKITIGNDVWIGEGVLVKPGVHIGDGAVVGSRSIVTHDVPPYSIVAGSPAIVRKMRFSEPIIEQLISLQWWKYAYWDLKGVKGDEKIENFISKVQRLADSKQLVPFFPESLTARDLLNAQ